MSVLSVSSNGASLSQDSIIAALREGVEAGLLNENFQIHYSGGGNFYNVDARVKGVRTFFSDLFSSYCFTLLFFLDRGITPSKDPRTAAPRLPLRSRPLAASSTDGRSPKEWMMRSF